MYWCFWRRFQVATDSLLVALNISDHANTPKVATHRFVGSRNGPKVAIASLGGHVLLCGDGKVCLLDTWLQVTLMEPRTALDTLQIPSPLASLSLHIRGSEHRFSGV